MMHCLKACKTAQVFSLYLCNLGAMFKGETSYLVENIFNHFANFFYCIFVSHVKASEQLAKFRNFIMQCFQRNCHKHLPKYWRDKSDMYK